MSDTENSIDKSDIAEINSFENVNETFDVETLDDDTAGDFKESEKDEQEGKVFGNVSDEDYDKEREKHGIRPWIFAVIIVLCVAVGALAGFMFYHWFCGHKMDNGANNTQGKNSLVSGSINTDEKLDKDESNRGEENDKSEENSSNSEDESSSMSVDGVKKLSTAQIYKSCVNSVVGITAEGTTTNIFGQVSKNASTGTGIIYSDDGYILTNYHVVEAGTAFTVTLYNGDTYKASLVGYEADNDVALIKIDAQNLQNAIMGNSDEIAVGEDITVIGNPLGELTYTLTRGVVSALNRVISTDDSPKNMFQIDAAVNSGNSGGPAFDATGKVVGIVTAKYSANAVEGIGFCIPINDAVKIAEELKEYGYIRGKTAIGICAVDSYLTYGYGWFNQRVLYGAKVTHIDKSFNAAKSGLSVGDMIVAVDDTTITTASDLQTILKSYSVGETVKITAYHADENNSYNEVIYNVIVGEYTPDIAPENWSKETHGEVV